MAQIILTLSIRPYYPSFPVSFPNYLLCPHKTQTNTSGEIGPESYGNEKFLCIPGLIRAIKCNLVSDTRYSLEVALHLCRDVVGAFYSLSQQGCSAKKIMNNRLIE